MYLSRYLSTWVSTSGWLRGAVPCRAVHLFGCYKYYVLRTTEDEEQDLFVDLLAFRSIYLQVGRPYSAVPVSVSVSLSVLCCCCCCCSKGVAAPVLLLWW